MAQQVFLGEPSPVIKQFFLRTFSSSKSITITYTSGEEVKQSISSSGITVDTIKQLNYSEIESIDFGQNVIEIGTDSFLDCDNLNQLIMEGYKSDTIVDKIADWGLGINSEGVTHLVIIYCQDGIIIINDQDSSSGEKMIHLDWDKFALMLEDYPTITTLPAIRTSVAVPYKVDMNANPIDTEWEIIGYNTSIPEFVKYKNGDERIYVSSLASGLLHDISVGESVLTKNESNEYISTGKVVESIASDVFTYGNNCTWSAPMSIVVDGVTYQFAGYNCTIMSKYMLGAKKDGILYHLGQFNSSSNIRNDWSSSLMRTWINGTGDTTKLANQRWYDSSWNNNTYNIPGLLHERLSDTKFNNHIVNTVNRTWVHSSWRSGKILDGEVEHCSDKFWLLGIGNVNNSGSNTDYDFKDQNYDTNIYSDIFDQVDAYNSDKSHVRRYMKEDGSKGTPGIWWLRSAFSSNYYSVAYIHDGGRTSSYYAHDSHGVLPACTIN